MQTIRRNTTKISLRRAANKRPSAVKKSNRDNILEFRTVIHEWMSSNSIKLKESTKLKYNHMIKKHIEPELGNRNVFAITSCDINSFLLNKKKYGRLNGNGGLSDSYVRTLAIIISSALNFAADEKKINFSKIKILKPTVIKQEAKSLSVREQIALEKYIFSNPSPTNLGILLSLYAGLRIGEVCALAWDDINLNEKFISVNHSLSRIESNVADTKTQLILDKPKTISSKRIVPISEEFTKTISEFKNISTSDFVVSEKMGFVSPRTFESRYKKSLKQCGIRTVNFHTLRHTFATRCIEAGVDIKSLSEIMGHANTSVTLNTYVHSSLDMKKKQIEKLTMLAM